MSIFDWFIDSLASKDVIDLEFIETELDNVAPLSEAEQGWISDGDSAADDPIGGGGG